MTPKSIRLGCGDLTHVGVVRRMWDTYRTWGETLCGAGGPVGGPARETDHEVTCPDCLRRMQVAKKARAA